jgi:hypothetical protein
MHATSILSSRRPPASGKSVQSTFEHARRLRRRGLGGFAALYPNRGKQKNLLLVYDMHHNFAFFLFLFCKSVSPKMQGHGAPSNRGGRMAHDDAENSTF